ncbi:MAG: type II secretion system GspH family protein [Fimbriimonadales bacterium]|nr:type II secretion system GspH family protein [Fimbriimonadales bacterium]
MRNSGFKVYEMIVVLAILMVLAGLLMPVLRNARLKTLQDVCASNLSQIHQAVLLYEQEHGALPMEGTLSRRPELKPYLGETQLWCPLAPSKSDLTAHEIRRYDYSIFGSPLPSAVTEKVRTCMRQAGDRAPIAGCWNHLRIAPNGFLLLIRRSGEVSIIDAKILAQKLRPKPIAVPPHQRGGALKIPCEALPNMIFNL